MKTVSHVSGKIDCDGVKKGRGGEERRGEEGRAGRGVCCALGTFSDSLQTQSAVWTFYRISFLDLY